MKCPLFVAIFAVFVFALRSEAVESLTFQSEPYDTYLQSISWASESSRLDNLAFYLKRFENNVVYIGYFVGDADSIEAVRARAKKAKRYLISNRKVDANRIKLICAGRLGKSRTSFYVLDKNEPSPDFAEPC